MKRLRKREQVKKTAKKRKLLAWRKVFIVSVLSGCFAAAGCMGNRKIVNAATADDVSTQEDVLIGGAYWTESRGNIVYQDKEGTARFCTSDITNLGMALQEIERKVQTQGIINPADNETYTARAEDVLCGKTFFNANKEGGAGADIGKMANMGNSALASVLATESGDGKIGDEGYSCTGYALIPFAGYYDTDSRITFDLTEHNRRCYEQGYADGYANSLENASIEYIYHYHDDTCPVESCTHTDTWSDAWQQDENVSDSWVAYWTQTVSNPKCPLERIENLIHKASAYQKAFTITSEHNLYTCGYEDGQLIGANIKFN